MVHEFKISSTLASLGRACKWLSGSLQWEDPSGTDSRNSKCAEEIQLWNPRQECLFALAIHLPESQQCGEQCGPVKWVGHIYYAPNGKNAQIHGETTLFSVETCFKTCILWCALINMTHFTLLRFSPLFLFNSHMQPRWEVKCFYFCVVVNATSWFLSI